MNTLYNQLNQTTSQNLSLINLAKSKNPEQALQVLAQSNPQIRSTLEYIQQSGKSPKELFYDMAKQKGIDPEEIIKMLK